MSNPIRYDPLLVAYLARELDGRLAGRRCRLLPSWDETRAATLPLEGGEALRLDLHPARGWIRLVPADETAAAAADAEIVRVSAPPDERWLAIELRGGNRFRPARRRVVVELHTNQWNLVVVDAGDGRILALPRARSAGARVLRPGVVYVPPPPRPRLDPAGVEREAAWRAWQALADVPPAERARALVRRFAYTGTLNALPLLGEAAAGNDTDALRAAFERWWTLASLPPPAPGLLRLPRGPHPYPLPLPGLGFEPAPGLLEAMQRAAEHDAPPAARADEPDARGWVEAAERRLRAAERKLQSLCRHLDQAGEAERARRYGDLLLAHLGAVPRGARSVRLPDWDGGEVEIPLDPALPPAENAARWYAEARRHARAEARLPALLREAEAEVERWRAIVERGSAGEMPDEAAMRELQPAARAGGAPAAVEGGRLPYRVFRTAGGLEVRVGRGGADNDRLTFGHSQPNDVWLHARSVPGSHVILRWADAEQAPPARDLAEAAGLAAWFSKARTSGLVAVDWTRRKLVRKPRGAPPGRVVPQRVKTIFVEPDPELEQRLAAPPEPGTAAAAGEA